MIKHIELINKNKKTLRGYLDLPDNASQLLVMFHGFTGNKTEHNGFFRSLSRELSEVGIASLRMDYSCNGESDGEFDEFIFDDAISDAKLMLDFASCVESIDELSILGYSMGGKVAAIVSSYKPITKLLLWSPSIRLSKRLQASFDSANKLKNGNVYLGGCQLTQAFIKSLDNYDPFPDLKNFNQPTLIIHGKKDIVVDYLEGVEYANTIPNANVYIIDGAGHGYDSYDYQTKLFKKSLFFLKKS